MSRIGKQPVPIPEKVKVDVKADNTVFVEGPKGKVNKTFSPVVKISIADKKVTFAPTEETRFSRAMYGTARSVVAGMVKGCADGYEKVLELKGTGYRVELKANTLHFALGFSHPIAFALPKGMTATIPADSKGTVLMLQCADKELIGQTAAKIRGFRPPEPYGGKGVRYRGERVREKAGKAGKGGKK